MSDDNSTRLRITVSALAVIYVMTFVSGFLQATPFNFLNYIFSSLLCIGGIGLMSGLCPRIADIYLADKLGSRNTGIDASPSNQPTKRQGHTVPELRQFAGTYHSDDLDIDYTFEVRDESHWLVRTKGIEQMKLKILMKDASSLLEQRRASGFLSRRNFRG